MNVKFITILQENEHLALRKLLDECEFDFYKEASEILGTAFEPDFFVNRLSPDCTKILLRYNIIDLAFFDTHWKRILLLDPIGTRGRENLCLLYDKFNEY